VYMSSGGESSPLTKGLWYLTDSDATATSTLPQSVGIAVSDIAINTAGTVRIAGVATTASSVVVGSTYYISSTPGGITTSAPSNSRVVGVANTTSTLVLAATSAVVATIPSPITQDLLFTDDTYDIGKSGATRPRDFFQSRNATIGGTLAVVGATTLTGGLNTPLVVAQGGTGLATLTSANVIIGNGTGTPSFVAPSTSGNVLKSTGSAWESAAASNSTPYVAAAVGSNILTLSVVSAAGAAPSSGSPVDITFRNITLATGAPTTISLTAATTVAIPDTALMGTTNDIPFRLWIVAFNDGGTVRLAAINCATTASVYPLAGWGIASATAVSTGADSAQVFYGSAGVTAKSYTVLGYVTYESGLSTAGTWSAVPTRVQSFDESVRLPGTQFNHVYARDTTGTTSSSNTDVDTGLTATITPSSAANLVLASAIHNGVQKNTGDTAAQLSLLSGGSIVVVWTRVEGRWSAVQLPDRTTAHHYTHLSGHDGYVAYTSDDAHGVSDQCVRMRTGKYLARFFGHHYSPAEIELWTDRVKALSGDVVHFARTPDECARVFEAPSITSCMGPKKFACPVCHTPWCIDHHPVRVYGGGDTAVAYLGRIDGKNAGAGAVTARCIVREDTKMYSRPYGPAAGTLREKLRAEGYRAGSMEGARILAIPRPGHRLRPDPTLPGVTSHWLMPYVDGIKHAELRPGPSNGGPSRQDETHHFVLGSGLLDTSTQRGWSAQCPH